MANENVKMYFVTTDAADNSWLVGTEWDNYNDGSYPAGSAGAIRITGAVQIPESATNITITYDLECGGTIAGLCGDLNVIEIGTVGNMQQVFNSGGRCWTCDLSAGCPVQNSGTYSMENVAGETVYIKMEGTGAGNGYVSIFLNAYAQFDIPLVPATVYVKLINPVGGAASGAIVTWQDITQNTQGYAPANENGVVTVTGVYVADTLNLTYDFAGLKASQKFEVSSVSTTLTYTFSCPANTVWNGSSCVNEVEAALSSAGKYILIAAGVIGGVAIAYEATKTVANRENRPYEGME